MCAGGWHTEICSSQLLRSSALYAPTFDKKLDRELRRDYGDPNFPTAHLRKDLDLFIRAAQQAGLNSEGLSGLAALLQRSSSTAAVGVDGTEDCLVLMLAVAVRAARSHAHCCC